MKNTPIITPPNRAGASFVIADNPTGLKHSSPMVCSRYVRISHIGLTLIPASADTAGGTSIKKPKPTNSSPSANFAATLGSRGPIFIHNIENSGASAISQIELTDWNQLDGNAIPRTKFRVFSSANRFSVEPACSNKDQNSAEPIDRQRITKMFRRSWPGLHAAHSAAKIPRKHAT